MGKALNLGDVEGPGSALAFENVGDKIKGTVKDPRMQQARDLDSGAPATWADGRPKMQLVIGMVVDGEDRTLYCNGGNFEVASGQGTSMQTAITDAVKAAGRSAIEEGGELVVVHSGLGKKTKAAYSAPKLYRAKYTPPTASVELDLDDEPVATPAVADGDLFGDD